MAIKSKGRGTAAAFGLLLLFAGLVGGGVLYMLSVRRHSQAVDGFARSPVGCTTTLRFTETGSFYVYEDLGPVIDVPDGGCRPVADPNQRFGFDLQGPDGPVVPRADTSVSYDTDDYLGTSVARIEIGVPGEYEIVVVGDDPAVTAAIGRDPDDGVDQLQQRAIMVAILGVLLGSLLLLLAGRRSKRAAHFLTPDGPGWGPQQPGHRVALPEPAQLARQAVNPHQPDEQVSIAAPLSEVNDLLSRPRAAKPATPWAPPVAGQAATVEPAAERPLVAQDAPPIPPATVQRAVGDAEGVVADAGNVVPVDGTVEATDEAADGATDEQVAE